jgi:signal transduction histidine kinase
LLDKRGVGVIKLFLKTKAQIDYEQSDLLTFIAKLLAEIIKAKKIADNIKKLHNDLRVLQENFQSIVTKSVDGIIIIDMQGVVQFANPAAKLLFGYLANSLIGMKFGIPSLTKEFIEIHIMRFSGEMGVAEMSVVETEWRGQPAFLAILHDITERKKMEEIIREKSNRLEELNKDLENTIREEVEKRRKHEQLLIQQSKLSAMGEMLGAIAHQWRQPLNAISILIQDIKLANQHGELDNDYINETVKTAKEQVRFLSQTIDDFRNFYKPCKEKSGFDVCNAILEILSLVNPQLVVSSIDVTVQTRDKDNRLLKTIAEMFTRYDHMDEHFIVLGYPNEFKQVILNLVNNARDAILEFRQQKKLDKGRIDILIKEEHKKVVIHVKDNGGGIPDHILDKIFIPYFTTKPFGQGTGIGLYMSKVIIESNMDGKLFAEVHDTDTIFTIELKKE